MILQAITAPTFAESIDLQIAPFVWLSCSEDNHPSNPRQISSSWISCFGGKPPRTAWVSVLVVEQAGGCTRKVDGLRDLRTRACYTSLQTTHIADMIIHYFRTPALSESQKLVLLGRVQKEISANGRFFAQSSKEV